MAIAEGPVVQLARIGPAMQAFYADVRARSEARHA
jgi:hypothetical protein